ncbi:response regulator transcription factor [Rhodococcus erythropolis]
MSGTKGQLRLTFSWQEDGAVGESVIPLFERKTKLMSVTVENCTAQEPVGPHLSEREVEVLRAWLLSDSKSRVAQDLYISVGTVGTHLSRIREKYADVGRNAPTKCELLVRAIQDQIVTIDEL